MAETRDGDDGVCWTALEGTVWDLAKRRGEALGPGHRREHGVVHTPPGLARPLLQWVDRHLREHRGLRGGLLNPRVFLVDPACGTGTFIAAALAVAGAPRKAQGAPLGVLCADLDDVALQTAEQALTAPLVERGWAVRFQHCNALEIEPRALLASVAEDCVPVVLGNPPWSVAAIRQPEVLAARLKDFQHMPDGSPLGERKLGVLRDRYVQFTRWALEVARCAPAGGVMAMVTNGSFVDGPVHRGMRAAMCAWSRRLSIVDLGGNAMLARDRRRDDNVFGVRPSVAVTLADCAGASEDRSSGWVGYRRVWGDAAAKRRELGRIALGQAPLPQVQPASPSFRFITPPPTADRYARFVALPELLPFHREGVQTNRDAVAIAHTKEALLRRLQDFIAGRGGDELALARTPRSHYDPERARTRVAAALLQDPDGRLGSSVRSLAYRRGEVRYLCPVAPLCHRPRPALLAAMTHSEVALASVRKDRGTSPWSHAAGLTLVADSSFLSARSSCRTRVFPSHGPDGEENLDATQAARVAAAVGAPVSAVEVLAYALAVLSAPAFVGAFDADLRLDYPRVPLPDSRERFAKLVRLGRGLFGPAGVELGSELGDRLDALIAPSWLPQRA